jgi:response regulator RpfG family c-di-GMP phosphodiesterase
MSDRILCVDDEQSVLEGFRRTLGRKFNLEFAVSGVEALNMIRRSGSYAVILADMNMPEMNGVQLLEQVQSLSPDTVRIMLTGNADQKTAVQATNVGRIYRFLNKPCPQETLELTLENALQQFRQIAAEKELLEKTLGGAIKLMSDVLCFSNPEGFAKSSHIREYCRRLQPFLKYDRWWALHIAAMLFNIGCVTLPPEVAQKAKLKEALSGPELNLFLRIPDIGASLIGNIPRLDQVAEIVRYQWKNFNGSGIPDDATSGNDIPLGSRILRVLIDLADLESSGLHATAALEIMRNRAGCYDLKVLEALSRCLNFHPAEAGSENLAPRGIKLSELRPGQVLIADLTTPEEVMIASTGTRLTQTLIERIRNFAELNGIKEPINVRG